MTGMAIQFIEQGSAGIGTSERRIIRSHVMRGKNAGRSRPSTRKQTKIVHVKRLLTPPGTPASKCPRPLLWNDLCLTSFPQQLDSEATKLIHRCIVFCTLRLLHLLTPLSGFFDISDALFPPQFCRKFDIVKSIWVNCVLADEACELSARRSFHAATLKSSGLPLHTCYIGVLRRLL